MSATSHNWIEFEDSTIHRYFYNRHSPDCVIVTKKDGFITGHTGIGDITKVKVFNTAEDAKCWVLKMNGHVGAKACPRCGYEGGV